MNACPRCNRHIFVDRREGTAHCIVHGEIQPAPTAAPITKRAPHRPWTPEDEAFALANQHTMHSGEIAAALGRSRKAVKHWFSRRQIRKPRVTRTRRHWPGPTEDRTGQRWSDEEIAALEDGDLRILVRARSHAAIANRAYRMGQPIRSGDGAMSVRQVAQRYHVRHATVLEWIKRSLLPAQRAGRLWRIDPIHAEKWVPRLKRASQANAGRRGWWQ